MKPDRFRVPGFCAVVGKPDGQVLRKQPFLVVEILSKDHTIHSMEERIDNWLYFGVPNVWRIDPPAHC